MHLFELEDQPWFPAIIRNLATDYLRFIEVKFALHRPVVPLLRDLLRRTETFSVVDLCSGGAGPIESIAKELSAEGINVKFTLTDLFPNVAAFQRAAHESSGLVGFVPDLVDARAVPRPLRGLRTMFNAFHHFDRQDAIAVLRDAADAGQPIAIFEIPDRKFRTLLPLLVLTPLMVAIATPFIAPFTWRRLLWTYLIPLVPLTCWWDGIISALRAYTPGEMQALANAVGQKNYHWQSGQVPIGSTPGNLTYLLGLPLKELGGISSRRAIFEYHENGRDKNQSAES